MSASTRRRVAASLIAAALLLGGCRGNGTGPSPQVVTLARFLGDAQFGTPGGMLAEPLQVRALDAATGQPAEGVVVQWKVVAGSGASVTALDPATDEFGIARARLMLGAATGEVAVEADAPRRQGSVPRFVAHAVLAPQIDAVVPGTIEAGQTVTVTGSQFHPQSQHNVVRFGGVRGRIVAATATQLTVEAPTCVATRQVDVQASIGAVTSNVLAVQTVGSAADQPAFAVGEARVFLAAQLGCLSLPVQADVGYMVIPQNVFTSAGPGAAFELLGFSGTAMLAATASPIAASPATRSAAADFELRLRTLETQWGPNDIVRVAPGDPDTVHGDPVAAATAVPALGSRTDFFVLEPDLTFGKVTAEVKHVSARAIIYQDIASPAPGLSAAAFTEFASLFDDPIYPTNVGVFGEPSDIDGNDRVIILFTPKVNALTTGGGGGFIAGYFYGCDLVDRQRCSGSNRAEIFYSIVPDPNGQFGPRRTESEVLRTVPAVLAHEFQHMIHFAQKNQTLDALWLSEALAHAAEDIVGEVLLARGETARAAEFRNSNYLRARLYVQAISSTGLLADKAPGSLEMRGGAWLLLKYLMGHYGGTTLLGNITRASASGVPNLEARVGRSWPTMLGDFAVALYADGTGLDVAPQHRFIGFSPRTVLRPTDGSYALAVQSQPYSGFLVGPALPPGSHGYFEVTTPLTATAPFHVSLTGSLGGDFAGLVAPQLVILRTQ